MILLQGLVVSIRVPWPRSPFPRMMFDGESVTSVVTAFGMFIIIDERMASSGLTLVCEIMRDERESEKKKALRAPVCLHYFIFFM